MVDVHNMFDMQSMWLKAYEIYRGDEPYKTMNSYGHRAIFCDLLLNELKKFRGRELEPFLGEVSIDIQKHTSNLTLCFPLDCIRSGATTVGEVEPNDTGSTNSFTS